MERIEYDGATGVLEVTVHGELYRFTGVPVEVYEQFTHASPREEFFEREIRGHYPYEHVPQALPADL